MSSETAAVEQDRTRRMPGEEGVWVFILGDMAVFALFFGTLIYTRAEDPAVFSTAQAKLSQGAGTINTILLLTSSLFVARGLHATRIGPPAAAARSFAAAMACALAFIIVKVFEYADKIDAGLTPATNDVWMYFFIFTGVHLLHVAIGIGVLIHLMRRVRRPAFTEHDRVIVESGACYWHLVDLLWIVLFALFYLMP